MAGQRDIFSCGRFPEDLSRNRWARILGEVRERARASGEAILDLTISNPTVAGLCWERGLVAAALSQGEIERYCPSPRGSVVARTAIAEFYKRVHGAEIFPERIHLTASTSEAYSWLTKLLCDGGDNILAPAPSYPLIEHLCGMEGIVARNYFLNFDNNARRWTTDFASMENAIDARTRAIFCVCPNNPTGSTFNAEERGRLLALSQQRQIPLVIDEVFLEYGNGDNNATRDLKTFAGTREAPIFVLGGLSKSAALPQVKVGWIITCGEEKFVEQALVRLDFVADAYLSSSTPSQNAVPALLAASGEIRGRIRERLDNNEKNLVAWSRMSRDAGLEILPRTAGWYSLLRLPRGVDEDALSFWLLRHENVVVHPGYFYDIPGEPAQHLALSLLTPPEVLAAALPRIDSALRHN
ncbi:MAG: pyridoxal phosphate-dependent aminotransferase [Opitutae bacterium]|nr:pyridoxal phosphate-dependent aminotransferase [Opitutae bacterium]